jgi:hypothetical protein
LFQLFFILYAAKASQIEVYDKNFRNTHAGGLKILLYHGIRRGSLLGFAAAWRGTDDGNDCGHHGVAK